MAGNSLASHAEYASTLCEGQEQALVRTLARMLTPSDILREGVERAMFVRPATGKGTESGDFCDSFVLDNGSVALIVGDVSGRGPQAAAKIPELRALLRLALYADPDPAKALAYINSILSQATSSDPAEPGRFVSMSIAVVQPHEGVGVFACAGLEPPMIVSTTAVHRSVLVGGMPLGLFKDAEYATSQRPVFRADLLLMGTNGIFEAGRPHRPLGTERFLKWANGLVPLHSLRAIGQMLMDEVESYAMGRISDDCSLMLARLL